MSLASPAIELRGAGRTFGDKVALHPLDLEVVPGEIFGLLGPNGSGKTTTLRILATLIRPTGGTAFIGGHNVVSDAMTVRRFIGVMPERPSLYERLTVRDNLVFWAEAHGLRDLDAAVDSAIEFAGLGEHVIERVGQLSKGWRQRVALARSLVHRPKVLLLDEPSSGLDPSAAAAMEGMIRTLAAGGTTVLMNTHRLAEAERLCDRVGILRHGRLLELGTPRQLRSRLLGGVVRVELTAPPDYHIRHAVESFPGLSGFELRGASFTCRIRDPLAGTPLLVSALVGSGAGVLSVVHAGDLEEAYLELMVRTDDQRLEVAA